LLRPEKKVKSPRIDPVVLINNETGLFWIAGLARELWSVLLPRIDELNDQARIAVQHYAEENHAYSSGTPVVE